MITALVRSVAWQPEEEWYSDQTDTAETADSANTAGAACTGVMVPPPRPRCEDRQTDAPD